MPPDSDRDELVVPLQAEQIEVARRSTVTGHVTVSTVTRAREEMIDELLTNEHAEVERIAIRQLIDEVPGIREEGDTIIIPIIEEVVVVERRLVLKEEVRIRRIRTTTRHQETVLLREQDAVIRRRPSETTRTAAAERSSDPPAPNEGSRHGQ
jgi:stress response protein YsnF